MFQDEEPKSREQILAATPPEVLREAESNLRDEELLNRLLEVVKTLGVAGEFNLVLTIYLVGTSRLLKKPLAAIVQGPSSSGKSFVIEKVASLFPPTETLLATDMTANALYYMPPGSLKHCFVVAGERNRRQHDGTASGTKALREIISAGRLSKSVPMPNPLTGEMETKLIEQEGPIAYVESTTLTKVFDEDANRCLILQTDEQATQTERILLNAARNACKPSTDRDIEHTLLVWRTMQLLLERKEVVVPFAVDLLNHFPSERVESRRAFPQALSVIGASALLHQYQREVIDGQVIANHQDYKITRQLVSDPISRELCGEMPPRVKSFYEDYCGLGEYPLTTREIAQELNRSERTIRDYLSDLYEAGAVELVESGRGPIGAKWRVVIGARLSSGRESVLPTVEEIFPIQQLPAETVSADLTTAPF